MTQKTAGRRRKLLLALLPPALLASASLPTVHATPSPGEQKVIERLIQRIANRGTMTFIRNGSEHDAANAAKHMQAKFDHFRERIVSAEDFIALCATRSEMTGQPYKVREGGGPLRDAGDFMTEELRLVRHELQRAG